MLTNKPKKILQAVVTAETAKMEKINMKSSPMQIWLLKIDQIQIVMWFSNNRDFNGWVRCLPWIRLSYPAIPPTDNEGRRRDSGPFKKAPLSPFSSMVR